MDSAQLNPELKFRLASCATLTQDHFTSSVSSGLEKPCDSKPEPSIELADETGLHLVPIADRSCSVDDQIIPQSESELPVSKSPCVTMLRLLSRAPSPRFYSTLCGMIFSVALLGM